MLKIVYDMLSKLLFLSSRILNENACFLLVFEKTRSSFCDTLAQGIDFFFHRLSQLLVGEIWSAVIVRRFLKILFRSWTYLEFSAVQTVNILLQKFYGFSKQFKQI